MLIPKASQEINVVLYQTYFGLPGMHQWTKTSPGSWHPFAQETSDIQAFSFKCPKTVVSRYSFTNFVSVVSILLVRFFFLGGESSRPWVSMAWLLALWWPPRPRAKAGRLGSCFWVKRLTSKNFCQTTERIKCGWNELINFWKVGLKWIEMDYKCGWWLQCCCQFFSVYHMAEKLGLSANSHFRSSNIFCWGSAIFWLMVNKSALANWPCDWKQLQ